MATPSLAFHRDRFTWLAYVFLGYYAYMQASLSPIMPFLRAELNLNYTVAGLHFTALAGGMVISSLTATSMTRRFGRHRMFWGGGAGMAAGGLLLVLSQQVLLTIFSSFLMGCLGTYLLVMIQATLSDHHQQNSALALTEANIFASIFATIVPLAVGFGAGIGIGWWLAIVAGVALWLIEWFANHRLALPAAAPATSNIQQSDKLPRLFWFYWLVLFVSVAIEWSIISWSPDFLENVVLLKRETAASIVSTFFLAMIIGRVGGSRLLRQMAAEQALWLAIGLLAIGFPLFWLGQIPAVNILGLLISGLGVANLFPLGLSMAARVGAATPDLASSRVTLAAGLAIFIMPQILGSVADITGIFRAFGTVIVLVLVLILVTLVAQWQAHHQSVL